MSVIPFNPVCGGRRPAGEPRLPGRPEGEAAPGTPAGTGRIELLERSLLAALRENATNWARAERRDD